MYIAIYVLQDALYQYPNSGVLYFIVAENIVTHVAIFQYTVVSLFVQCEYLQQFCHVQNYYLCVLLIGTVGCRIKLT